MQGDLFGNPPGNLPEGFRYQAGIVPQKLQEVLLEAMPGLLFKPFDFHAYEGRRRVVSFATWQSCARLSSASVSLALLVFIV